MGYKEDVARDRKRMEKEREAAAAGSGGGGMQLAFHCEVKPGPDGTLWIGMSFGMGTGTYTLGLPVAMWDGFKKLLVETGDQAIADAQSQVSVVNTPKLILPN